MNLDAFLDGFVGLEGMCRHLLPGASVDDEWFSPQPSRRPGRIHRGVAAAINCDSPTDVRRRGTLLDAGKKLQGVVDLAGIARRDVLPPTEVRADRKKDGVETARRLLDQKVLDLVVEHYLDADVLNALDFCVEYLARETVLGDAEMHHAACHRSGFEDDHRMPEQREVPRRREAARARSHHEHTPARLRNAASDGPPLRERLVTEEALDRMDAHRVVDILAVARVLARVIADAAVDGRQRVISDDDLPGFAETASLRFGKPRLDVLTSGARVIARRQSIDVLRPHRSDGRPMTVWIASVDIRHEAAPLLSRGGRARPTRVGRMDNREMCEPLPGAFWGAAFGNGS